MNAIVHYRGSATGRILSHEDTPELVGTYHWHPDNGYACPLDERDREWFLTAPGNEFSILEAPAPALSADPAAE